MEGIELTAGITLRTDRVLTAEVAALDAEGIHLKADPDGPAPPFVAWGEVKAMMLASTDHMLESGGYLFAMAEQVGAQEQAQPYDAAEMRNRGLAVLAEAAPRLCPQGDACPLARTPAGD